MNIIELKERQDISNNSTVSGIYAQLEALLKQLEGKELPDNVIQLINEQIEVLNSTSLAGNGLKRLIKQKQTRIVNLVEKKLKMAPKNYYRNLWLVIGMSAFGLPIGLTFGLSSGNMGLLAAGLPIGMGVGIVIGLAMDKKAAEEGRQLDIEINF